MEEKLTHPWPEPEVRIGSLIIRPGYEGRHKVWIEQASGEGGDFPVADVEAILQAYYKDNF